MQDALREMAILRKLCHKNIIRLYEIIHYVEKGKILMINELADYGSVMKYDESTGEFHLNEQLKEDGQIYYSEDQIRNLFRDIISGIDYRKIISLSSSCEWSSSQRYQTRQCFG